MTVHRRVTHRKLKPKKPKHKAAPKPKKPKVHHVAKPHDHHEKKLKKVTLHDVHAANTVLRF